VHGNNTPKSSLASATLPRTTVAAAIIGVTKFLSQSVIKTKGDIVKYSKKAPRKYSLSDCVITVALNWAALPIILKSKVDNHATAVKIIIHIKSIKNFAVKKAPFETGTVSTDFNVFSVYSRLKRYTAITPYTITPNKRSTYKFVCSSISQ